jgi:hypothetical protein
MKIRSENVTVELYFFQVYMTSFAQDHVSRVESPARFRFLVAVGTSAISIYTSLRIYILHTYGNIQERCVVMKLVVYFVRMMLVSVNVNVAKPS